MLDFYDLSECANMSTTRIRRKVNRGGEDTNMYIIVVRGVDFQITLSFPRGRGSSKYPLDLQRNII